MDIAAPAMGPANNKSVIVFRRAHPASARDRVRYIRSTQPGIVKIKVARVNPTKKPVGSSAPVPPDHAIKSNVERVLPNRAERMTAKTCRSIR